MDETQALKTLQRIEKLLEQSLLANKGAAPSEQRRLPGGKGGKQSQDSESLDKTIIVATRGLKDLTFEAEKLGKSFRGVRGDLLGMRKGIRALGSSFTGAVSKIDSVAEVKGPAEGSDALVRSVDDFAGSVETVKATVRDIDDFAGDLGEAVAESTATIRSSARDVDDFAGELESAGRDVDDFSGKVEEAGEETEKFKIELRNALRILGDAFVGLGKDIFYLQARGVSAASSLAGLYGDAITAGMSLQEYTEMMEDNQAAVVRARSFDDFGDRVDKTTHDLARLGTFGPAAERLAASMQTNSVMLGIPMEKQADATNAQVKQFEKLRKTTMMTSTAFQELMKDIASNENVQEDLIGLAPAERQARMAQLMDTATLGQQMGLTKEASAGLTNALLAQRKATAQQRMQAAGLIRQAGAITGMSAGETEELARLSQKKRKTPEEEKRFVELSGQMESRLQAMQNTGNIQAEFIGEQLSEKLAGTPYGEAQKAAAKAKLQTDAGPVQNEEIGKETGGILQTIGKGMTVFSGFAKNPLGEAAIEVTGLVAQTAIQSMWYAKILAAIQGKGIGAATGAMKFLKDFGSKVSGVFSTIATTAGKVLTPITGIFKGIFSSVTGMFSSAFSSISGLAAKAVGSVSGMFNGAVAAVKGIFSSISGFFKGSALLGGIISAIEELFTGEMGAALGFGEGLFGKLGGMLIAGLNGLFTGFTRIFDWGVNSVFEALGISFKVNTTKIIDYGTSAFVDFWKMLGAGILKGLALIIESLPFVGKDNKWVKGLRAQADELDQGIAEGAKLREDLWKKEGATLRSIGEENQKALEKSKKKTEVLVNDRVTTLDDLAASASRTVQSVRNVNAEAARKEEEKKKKEEKKKEEPVKAEPAKKENIQAEPAKQTVQAEPVKKEAVQAAPAQQQPPQVATPQPAKQPTVVEPGLNKNETPATTETTPAEGTAVAATKEGLSQAELLTVAQQQLEVLKQTLAFLTSQGDPTENMLKSLNRPEMTSAEKLWGFITTGTA